MQIRTNQVRHGIVLQVLHLVTAVLVLTACTLDGERWVAGAVRSS
jgi:hypothetical protein